jgi:hypothetical protein
VHFPVNKKPVKKRDPYEVDPTQDKTLAAVLQYVEKELSSPLRKSSSLSAK